MISHWQAPDPIGDLATHVFRHDRAPATRVRVRPELARRLAAEHSRQVDGHTGHRSTWSATVGDLAGVPITVDLALPAYPGYEIDRAHPRQTAA